MKNTSWNFVKLYQLAAVELALGLEVKTGLRHSRNATRKTAKVLLENAGKIPTRKVADLWQQIKQLRQEATASGN